MPSAQAAAEANIFVTATGDFNVIDLPQLAALRDGAILANSGHFNDEINIPALDEHRRSSGGRFGILSKSSVWPTAEGSFCSPTAG